MAGGPGVAPTHVMVGAPGGPKEKVWGSVWPVERLPAFAPGQSGSRTPPPPCVGALALSRFRRGAVPPIQSRLQPQNWRLYPCPPLPAVAPNHLLATLPRLPPHMIERTRRLPVTRPICCENILDSFMEVLELIDIFME